MWRFAALAIVFLFSLPNHADSVRLSRPGNLNRQKPLLAAKLSTPAEFLAAHNKIREIHNLTLLAWDQKLAGYARWWADTRLDNCKKLLHSPNSPYGENLFWALRDHWNASKVVKYWGDERNLYDPNTNECINNSVCGHYTQIVWNATQRVGCAHVLCHNIQGHLFVCSYDPPGNIYYHGPFGGRFNKSIVNPPPSNNASSAILGSQSGITGNKANYIVSSTTGHPANKTYKRKSRTCNCIQKIFTGKFSGYMCFSIYTQQAINIYDSDLWSQFYQNYSAVCANYLRFGKRPTKTSDSQCEWSRIMVNPRHSS